jgi:hypothetical protein
MLNSPQLNTALVRRTSEANHALRNTTQQCHSKCTPFRHNCFDPARQSVLRGLRQTTTWRELSLATVATLTGRQYSSCQKAASYATKCPTGSGQVWYCSVSVINVRCFDMEVWHTHGTPAVMMMM